jgi:hypothetical protein
MAKPWSHSEMNGSSFKTAQRGGQAQFAPKTAHDHRGDGARPVPGGFETASRKLSIASAVMIGIGVLLAGCSGSGRPATAPVRGQVRYEGRPVANATVAFLCPGAPRLAVGTTDQSGNYQLTTYEENDGAIIGTHVVTVNLYASESEADALGSDSSASGQPTSKSIEEAMRRSVKQIEKAEKAKPPIPTKYSDRRTSDLQKEVVDGENVIDIDLID